MLKRRLGDVIEVPMPRGRFAYGRLYRDAQVAFYRARTTEPGTPPIGSRDFDFVVGVSDGALKEVRVVGFDPFDTGESDWPPPMSIRDPISGGYSIYHRGEVRPSTVSEASGLERAAVWDLVQLQARLDRAS
jgi:hypothetical protein